MTCSTAGAAWKGLDGTGGGQVTCGLLGLVQGVIRVLEGVGGSVHTSLLVFDCNLYFLLRHLFKQAMVTPSLQPTLSVCPV